jgi:hypothetical protein
MYSEKIDKKSSEVGLCTISRRLRSLIFIEGNKDIFQIEIIKTVALGKISIFRT